MADNVKVERHNGWAELIFNRPERKNAIDGPFAEDFLAALQDLNGDAQIRAIVLRGAGGAYCSGLDLKAFNAEPKPDWVAGFHARWHEVHCALAESRKVLIGALERYAINGGAALALAPDLLVAGETAFLQVGEVQIGMGAPKNMAWLLLRFNEAIAARLTLLGDRVAGPELLRLGIATEVAPDDQVVARARALAERIAAFPSEGVSRIKSSMRAASALRSPRDWFDAVQAHDPLAKQGAVAPAKVK